MKKLILIPILLLVVFVANAHNPNKLIIVKTKIYCDHCLQCGSCGENIETYIKKNAGVKKVTVNPTANTISVVYDDSKTTKLKIQESLRKAGFEADGQMPTVKAYNALDGCCKKPE